MLRLVAEVRALLGCTGTPSLGDAIGHAGAAVDQAIGQKEAESTGAEVKKENHLKNKKNTDSGEELASTGVEICHTAGPQDASG